MSDPTTQNQREWFCKHTLEAYRKIPFHRDSALDLASLNQLAAIAVSFRDVENEAGRRFEIDELAKVYEALAQEGPAQVANTATMLPPHPVPTFTPDVHDPSPVRKP